MIPRGTPPSTSHEQAALEELTVINIAQITYKAGVQVHAGDSYEGGHARFACSLCELYDDHLIRPGLASGGDGAYAYGLRCFLAGKDYTVIAIPQMPQGRGLRRLFCSDASGQLRAKEGKLLLSIATPDGLMDDCPNWKEVTLRP